jgi:hypothetical protein
MGLEAKSAEEFEEIFELFLTKMDDRPFEFTQKSKSQGLSLDYSLRSLGDLEKYLLSNKTMVNENDLNDAATYFGEVIRKNYGGKWRCSLDKKKNSINYGFPVLHGHSKYDIELNPFHSVKSYILRNRKDHFFIIVKNQISPDVLDLSHLPTEIDPE